jgi:hypothetical protein
MPNPKSYFHDRVILLLLSINVFLALLASVLVLLRLDSNRGNYIVQYRANLGISAFSTGHTSEILAFIAFAGLVVAVHSVISMRMYKVHRPLSITILSLGILLLTLSTIVSNALLVLR